MSGMAGADEATSACSHSLSVHDLGKGSRGTKRHVLYWASLTSGAAIARRATERLASWRNIGKTATFGTLCAEVLTGAGDADARRHAPKFAEANMLCAAMAMMGSL